VSPVDAARFLAQASYGPTAADIARVSASGPAVWLDEQFAQPQQLHRQYMDTMAANLAANGSTVTPSHFRESYWQQAINGPDQLRQRAAFALSQIFVVSFVEPSLTARPRGVASYYDMLGERAFGNFRDLLEGVTLHPMMGVYLSTLRNQKEDPVTGRNADQNYAREVMQLFTIGLHELNADGTAKPGPVDTYSDADIEGLAKVFTGWSWYAGANLADRTDRRFQGLDGHLERDWRPMQSYAKFHSTSEKRFLGTVIPASGTSNPEADLKVALDRLFQHPNVGPFIGRQLIQRMVTSNPSPAYVARVATAFADNGRGVRGDMKAVWRAILLDPEARTYQSGSTIFGKPREPILRLSHFLRAFAAKSTSGRFTGIGDTDLQSRLSQSVLQAPSVFNFYRPGYTPPNSAAAAAGLVAPEWQLANEVTLAGYVNYLRAAWLVANSSRDVQPDFSAELALAHDAGALVDRLNLVLMSGQMSASQRQLIVGAVNGRSLPAPTSTNQASVDAARRDRVCIAILLTMASPEYIIQK
jgi:uncharacterized protein (DUF1800 family)